MEAGEILEFDSPHILLQDPSGIFTDMVRKTGPGTSEALKQIAKVVTRFSWIDLFMSTLR